MKRLITSRLFDVIKISLFLVFLLISVSALARVGGAGGSSSDSSGGGELIGIAIYIFTMIPFPWNLIVLGIVIVLFYLANKKAKQQSILNKMPTGETPVKARGYDNFALNNPGFDKNKFIEDVKNRFVLIQQAWMEKDMKKVRNFISDGMYQRLNTQFTMMTLLTQKNSLEKIDIKNVYLDSIESDGKFDIIHVAIHAYLVDRFVSEKYSKLNSGGAEEFVEYWSFIKKRGAGDSSFVQSVCPSCAAELSANSGEVCKCSYCGVMINSPEYGWILSEITQADDYISSSVVSSKLQDLKSRILALTDENEDFSVQLAEDKASNAYMQIQTALVTKKKESVRRFLSDEVYNKLSERIEKESPFVYNRLFLNDVTLIAIGEKDNSNILVFSLKCSSQKVSTENDKLRIIDQTVTARNDVLVMSRSKNSEKSKGSVYMHSCPSCGGSVGDTTDIKCPYCGNELNSNVTDWIVDKFLSYNEYMEYFSQNSAMFFAPLKPGKDDSAFKARDFAFNNVLLMIAADGVFDESEIDFANKMAGKLGYNVSKVQPMLQQAKAGKLVLRMPEDQKQRIKVFEIMNKAASIDGRVSVEEQQLLDSIQKQYLS